MGIFPWDFPIIGNWGQDSLALTGIFHPSGSFFCVWVQAESWNSWSRLALSPWLIIYGAKRPLCPAPQLQDSEAE